MRKAVLYSRGFNTHRAYWKQNNGNTASNLCTNLFGWITEQEQKMIIKNVKLFRVSQKSMCILLNILIILIYFIDKKWIEITMKMNQIEE